MAANTWPTGSIVHVELYTDDLAATRRFYEAAFGWSSEPVEGMEEYVMWEAPDPPFGGFVERSSMAFPAPTTLCYVDVDDLAATVEAIADAGGEVLVEEQTVPGMGVFAVFRDPGGVVEAAWEARPEGELVGEEMPRPSETPGPGSLVHFELYTEDIPATRAFHEAVFGWAFEDVSDGGYTVARPPGPPAGGLMPATDEWPTGTLIYHLVDSAATATRTIEAAGGHVLREPFDVEGWGTMAVFEAPGGVVGAVWEAAPMAEETPREAAPER